MFRDIFSLGFGPFRWVCCSGEPRDLEKTDKAAADVFVQLMEEGILRSAIKSAYKPFLYPHAIPIAIPISDKDMDPDVRGLYKENLTWIQEASDHRMVVGSQARILYSDCVGRIRLASRFNELIKSGELQVQIRLQYNTLIFSIYSYVYV
jgi:urocanate hydratase